MKAPLFLSPVVYAAVVSFCFAISPFGGLRAADDDLVIPRLFSEHMVLQADKPVPIWGFAASGSVVTVTYFGVPYTATAGAGNTWKLTLPAKPKGGPYNGQLTVKKGTKTIAIDDVLIGDVWIGSGQSNMEFMLKEVANGASELDAAQTGSTNIRVFRVPNRVSLTPQSDFAPVDPAEAKWVVIDSAWPGEFSAVLYYFGREIRDKRTTPVGLIDCSYGGTSIEAWMSQEYLFKSAVGQESYLRTTDEQLNNAAYTTVYNTRKAEWDAYKLLAAPEHWPLPTAPAVPMKNGDRKTATGLYNGMLNPLIPFALKGVLWYQGEKNARFYAFEYREMLPFLIRDWRARWNETVPFYLVQLPNYNPPGPEQHQWPVERESQATALSEPAMAMVVTIEQGVPNDVHPTVKSEVGHRLALAARAKTYGENISWGSPLYRSSQLSGSTLILSFDQVKNQLVGIAGTSVQGFEVAGSDGKFYPATAQIVSNTTVQVASSSVTMPTQARYLWRNQPAAGDVSLYGQGDPGNPGPGNLPAAPFRTASPSIASVPKKDTVFTNGEGGKQTFRSPAIVRTNKGTLLAFAGANSGTDTDIVVKRGFYDAHTNEVRWDPVITVADGANVDQLTFPTPVVDAKTSDIYLFYTKNGNSISYVKSTDDGLNWLVPSPAFTIDCFPGETMDLANAALGTGPGHGLQLTEGANKGRIVIPYHYRTNANVKRTRILYSDDGATWTVSPAINAITAAPARMIHEASCAQLAGGAIYFNTRNGIAYQSGNSETLRRLSFKTTDFLATHTPFVREPDLPDPAWAGSVLRIFTNNYDYTHLALSNLAHQNWDVAQKKFLTLSNTFDETATWPTKKLLDGGYAGASDLVQFQLIETGVLYEAGTTVSGQRVDFAWFNTSWLTDPAFAAWDFNEKPTGELAVAGDSIKNSASFALAGTMTGTAKYVPGPQIGEVALDLGSTSAGDGSTTDYLTVPDAETNKVFDFGAEQSFGFEARLKTLNDQGGILGIISKDGSSGPRWWLRLNDGFVQFLIRDDNISTLAASTIRVNDGNWHTIAVGREATTNEVYIKIDGNVNIIVNDVTTGAIANTANVRVGNFSTLSAPFVGQLSYVKALKYED